MPDPGKKDTTTNDKEAREETNKRTPPKRPNKTTYTETKDIREKERERERKATLWTTRRRRRRTIRRIIDEAKQTK